MVTRWLDTLHEDDVASAGAHTKSLMAGISPEVTSHWTLLRTILCHDYAYVVHDSGEGSQTLDIGIGITSQEAFAAVTLPDPSVEGDRPTRGWIYRCRHRVFGFAADQPAVNVVRIYRDIRAKRKLENGECYLILNNTANEGTTGAVNITGVTRQLWLIH